MVWCINAQLFTAYCAETPSADKSDRFQYRSVSTELGKTDDLVLIGQIQRVALDSFSGDTRLGKSPRATGATPTNPLKSRARDLKGTMCCNELTQRGIALIDPMGYNPDDRAIEQLVARKKQN